MRCSAKVVDSKDCRSMPTRLLSTSSKSYWISYCEVNEISRLNIYLFIYSRRTRQFDISISFIQVYNSVFSTTILRFSRNVKACGFIKSYVIFLGEYQHWGLVELVFFEIISSQVWWSIKLPINKNKRLENVKAHNSWNHMWPTLFLRKAYMHVIRTYSVMYFHSRNLNRSWKYILNIRNATNTLL